MLKMKDTNLFFCYRREDTVRLPILYVCTVNLQSNRYYSEGPCITLTCLYIFLLINPYGVAISAMIHHSIQFVWVIRTTDLIFNRDWVIVIIQPQQGYPGATAFWTFNHDYVGILSRLRSCANSSSALCCSSASVCCALINTTLHIVMRSPTEKSSSSIGGSVSSACSGSTENQSDSSASSSPSSSSSSSHVPQSSPHSRTLSL